MRGQSATAPSPALQADEVAVARPVGPAPRTATRAAVRPRVRLSVRPPIQLTVRPPVQPQIQLRSELRNLPVHPQSRPCAASIGRRPVGRSPLRKAGEGTGCRSAIGALLSDRRTSRATFDARTPPPASARQHARSRWRERRSAPGCQARWHYKAGGRRRPLPAVMRRRYVAAKYAAALLALRREHLRREDFTSRPRVSSFWPEVRAARISLSAKAVAALLHQRHDSPSGVDPSFRTSGGASKLPESGTWASREGNTRSIGTRCA